MSDDTRRAALAASEQEQSSSERPLGVAVSTTYLPELEGARGVAMLVVLLFHTDGFICFGTNPASGTWFSPLTAFMKIGGGFGVDLFFVLSAFLLSLPFIKAGRAGRLPSVRRYFMRRALRILPLYYVFVLLGAAVTAGHWRDLARGVPFLFFLNSLPDVVVPMPPFSNVWWSLATEWEFYVILPIIGWLCLTRFGRRLALLAAVAYGAAYGAWLAGYVRGGTLGAQMTLMFSLFGRGWLFLAGAFTAWLYARHGDSITARLGARSWLARGGADALLVLVILAIGSALSWAGWFGKQAAEVVPWHAHHIGEALLCVVFVGLITMAPATYGRRVLSSPVMRRLGVLSYSVYMVHLPVVDYGLRFLRSWPIPGLINWNWRTVLAACGLWSICFALAACSYRFIERPFLVRKERVAS